MDVVLPVLRIDFYLANCFRTTFPVVWLVRPVQRKSSRDLAFSRKVLCSSCNAVLLTRVVETRDLSVITFVFKKKKKNTLGAIKIRWSRPTSWRRNVTTTTRHHQHSVPEVDRRITRVDQRRLLIFFSFYFITISTEKFFCVYGVVSGQWNSPGAGVKIQNPPLVLITGRTTSRWIHNRLSSVAYIYKYIYK